jgi:hypothetical protein
VSDALGALTRVADHGLLDRLIRGRLWIGLIAFALIGIVAMQLVVLRLNTEVGKGLERKANLQREISSLQVATSALTAAEHVQSEALRHGMQAATSDASQFLTAQPGAVASAARLLAGGGPSEQSGHTQEGGTAHGAETSEAHGAETGGASGQESEHTAAGEAAPASSHEAEAPASQAASGAGGGAGASAEPSEAHGSEASGGASAASGAGASEANGGSAAGLGAPHG